ncbi:MAG: YqkE family protein [Planctomycetota bacterium]|jgi:hypothetical protein
MRQKAGAITVLRSFLCFVSFLAVVVVSGCGTSYVTPGAGAQLSALAETDLSQVTDADIQEIMDRKPVSPFPAIMGYIRLQSPGYRSYSFASYGRGRYSVVPTRDIETDEDFKRLADLPMIRDIVPLGRALIPPKLDSHRQLRHSAAQLHADLLLVYTLDTAFRIKDHDIGPLGVITLGFLPNHEARITTTASAVLFDVRTAYVYGLVEATEYEEQMASAWTANKAVEEARKRAERKAFEELLNELSLMWKDVVEQYAGR